jgi:hypothetical protein
MTSGLLTLETFVPFAMQFPDIEEPDFQYRLQLVDPLDGVHPTVFCKLPAVAETPVGAAGMVAIDPPPPAIIIPDKPVA